jgi:hypothetical protein
MYRLLELLAVLVGDGVCDVLVGWAVGDVVGVGVGVGVEVGLGVDVGVGVGVGVAAGISAKFAVIVPGPFMFAVVELACEFPIELAASVVHEENL